MVGAKMWARRVMASAALLGFFCGASAFAYRVAGAAMSVGSIAFAR